MAGPSPNPAEESPAAERGELRAIADQLLDILDQLRTYEERKRVEPMGSPEFVALAEAAEIQGRLVFRWTGLQLELARDAAHRRATGQLDPDLRIVDVRPRPLDSILASWREAQIRLEIAKPGSPEAAEAADAVERLREEYRAVAEYKSEDAADLATRPGLPSRPDDR
jgi:hypothetical protein